MLRKLLVVVISLTALSAVNVVEYVNSVSASVNRKLINQEFTGGRFTVPGRGQVLQAVIPLRIQWELDKRLEIASQNLILSTDGGTIFDLMIAANLPPTQKQLIWAASSPIMTAKGRLKLVLNLTSGKQVEVVSDEFSILPAPPEASEIASTMVEAMVEQGMANNITPSFAGTGTCVASAGPPTLNYNMSHNVKCFPSYGGEPSLAQDPLNPSHFHTATGRFAGINSKNVDWAFTGTGKGSGLNFNGLTSRGI